MKKEGRIGEFEEYFIDGDKTISISPADLLGHKTWVCDPSKEDFEEYAALHADLFLYEDPLLLSRDRKKLYGYCSDDLQELVIPDEVEIYDNFCYHSELEPRGDYSVEIGSGLKQIVDISESFGYDNIGFSIKAGNPYFSVVQNMLYDKDEKTLICYPSGKTSKYWGRRRSYGEDMDDYFVQLPMSTVKISRDAFYMRILPLTLVIPDSVKSIEPWAFHERSAYLLEENDVKSRRIILPERFREIIDKTWAEDDGGRPTIEFY